MISGERKKFNLRGARKPMLIDGLSNTVIVYIDDQPHYCLISFDPSLVELVGKELQRGVSLLDPAFLQVYFDKQRAKWIIAAAYVATWEQQELWAADDRPSWVKELKLIRHTNEHTNARSTPGRKARTSGASSRDTITVTNTINA
jgi:hypothetical protein